MKKTIIFLFAFTAFNLYAQRNARFGRGFAPYGTFKVLTVFADVVDDTVDYSFPWWSEGQLPDLADDLFDAYDNTIHYATDRKTLIRQDTKLLIT